MTTYRYSLEKSSRKHLCPNCNKKRFVRYIDTESGQYLPEQYGRCDREAECAYHLNPFSDGFAQRMQENKGPYGFSSGHSTHSFRPKSQIITFIPAEVLMKTRQGWEHNTFLQNLLNRIPYPFPPSDIEKIIVQYQLGTVMKGYMAGAVTFPFIDEKNNIRAIQAKKFDELNHTTSTSFLHSIIEKNLSASNRPIPSWLKSYNDNESKVSCLFGAHLLLKYPKNPVALVEAPKTAIIGTLYFGFPDVHSNLLWLAVYNLSSLSIEKCKVLYGRKVILFPDLSRKGTAFELWSRKAQELEKQIPGSNFIIYDLLEQKAGQYARESGYDLADFLIRFPIDLFKLVPNAQPP